MMYITDICIYYICNTHIDDKKVKEEVINLGSGEDTRGDGGEMKQWK